MHVRMFTYIIIGCEVQNSSFLENKCQFFTFFLFHIGHQHSYSCLLFICRKEISAMASSALEKTEEEKKYKAFRSKVKRTVYVDNISPKVEKEALKKAFEQHGNVVEVEFIPTYREWFPFPDITSKRALLVMENEQQANNIIDTVNEYPFMICGMPRPVRAFPAVAKMFPFRPPPPDRKIMCTWIGPDDPNFARAQKAKELIRKHSQEVEFLHYVRYIAIHHLY